MRDRRGQREKSGGSVTVERSAPVDATRIFLILAQRRVATQQARQCIATCLDILKSVLDWADLDQANLDDF